MFNLPFSRPGRRGAARRELPLLGLPDTKTLSRGEAQAAVDAAALAIDGLKVLLVLGAQGDSNARFALRQWRDVLGELASL